MALPLFFIDLYDGTDFTLLNEETSRHVVQVLRMDKGEHLQLTDGKGTLLAAAVADAHKKKCTVRVFEKITAPPPTRNVSIGISLLKNAARFEWFLEKATEIGVTHIVPMLCERTEKQHFRTERMRQVTIAAMLQSQQFWLPRLEQPLPYASFIQQHSAETKLIAHCEPEQKQNIPVPTADSAVAILIGPEGDFSKQEIALALEAGYTPVSLGKTRLRTETAGVVAATLLCVP